MNSRRNLALILVAVLTSASAGAADETMFSYSTLIRETALASEADIPTADICQQLARYGVKAEGSQAVGKELDSGTALLSR